MEDALTGGVEQHQVTDTGWNVEPDPGLQGCVPTVSLDSALMLAEATPSYVNASAGGGSSADGHDDGESRERKPGFVGANPQDPRRPQRAPRHRRGAAVTPVDVFGHEYDRAFQSGNEHHDRGDFAAAVDSYTTAIRLMPEAAYARFNRANSLAMLGRFNLAIADYDAALRIEPRLDEATINRAAVIGLISDGRRQQELPQSWPALPSTGCTEVNEREQLPVPEGPTANVASPTQGRVAALVPAHNEESIIGSAIESLLRQTRPIDLICIISDNSTDRTVSIAKEYSRTHPQVLVLETVNNKAKKAGALNQAMKVIGLDSYEYIFQMDADSIIAEDLIHQGLIEFATDTQIGGLCSSAFLMQPRTGAGLVGRWLWRLQNIEYGFAQAWRMESPDDSRVLAGIGSLLRSSALKDIEQVRGDGQYWDESSIVEDYVIGLAMKDRGWRVKPAPRMVLFTDGQITIGDLWRQRLRWYTGTINEVRKRKLRRHSRMELFGILLALTCLLVRLALFVIVAFWLLGIVELRFNWWMIVLPGITLGHNAYRLKYVHGLDVKQRALALSVFPMDVYDTFQQVTYLVSTVRSYRGVTSW